MSTVAPWEENADKAAVNLFFSPYTGSDETGDGSQFSPFKTQTQAEKAAQTLIIQENEKLYILEYLMEIEVRLQQAHSIRSKQDNGRIIMIPFTCKADSYYFKGESVGPCCDTQKWGIPGSPAFSARYMLRGTDFQGQECSIFIENNGNDMSRCVPTIITDSQGLSEWETAKKRAIVLPNGTGVTVYCYKIVN